MKSKNHKELIKTIKNEKPCFVIGNGINRFNQRKTENDVSWEGILLEIYNETTGKQRNLIPEGIALTEFYDIIDLDKNNNSKYFIQQQFADKLNFKPKQHHTKIVSKIKKINAPILTTNFDFTLQKTIDAEMFNYKKEGQRLLTDYYPWDRYFSDSKKDDPFNSFSIWHMHGQENYTRSIKLGLNQYLLMVNRAKNHFPSNNTDDKLTKYDT